jgi:hypothetical protein
MRLASALASSPAVEEQRSGGVRRPCAGRRKTTAAAVFLLKRTRPPPQTGCASVRDFEYETAASNLDLPTVAGSRTDLEFAQPEDYLGSADIVDEDGMRDGYLDDAQ